MMSVVRFFAMLSDNSPPTPTPLLLLPPREAFQSENFGLGFIYEWSVRKLTEFVLNLQLRLLYLVMPVNVLPTTGAMKGDSNSKIVQKAPKTIEGSDWLENSTTH